MPEYTCSKCGAVAAENATGLVWHLKNRHALLVGRMFTSPVTCGQNGCMRTFCYSYALVRHIENTHGLVSVESHDNDIPVVHDSGEDDDPAAQIHPSVHGDDLAVPQEQPPEHDLDEEDVRNSAAVFIAKMKASSSTVQSTVDYVVTEASNLFSDVIGKLKRKTEEFLQSKNIEEDDIQRKNLLHVFDECQNPFTQLETSHQQEKYFTQSGYFIKPREISLGIEYHPRNNPTTGHVDQKAKHATFQYVPLPEVLKPFWKVREL